MNQGAAVIASMAALNKEACEAMQLFAGVHGCTDVTGFSLGGHLIEMAQASGLTIQLEAQKIPVFPGAMDLAEMGIIPGGTYRNREHFACHYENLKEDFWEDIVFDPQTSGGLLISVSAADLEPLKVELEKNLKTDWAVIGQLVEKENKLLKIL